MGLIEYIREVINMDKWNENSIVPRWMRITMVVFKILMAFIPFAMISVMTIIHSYDSAWDNWLVTCVYLLSLSHFISRMDD